MNIDKRVALRNTFKKNEGKEFINDNATHFTSEYVNWLEEQLN